MNIDGNAVFDSKPRSFGDLDIRPGTDADKGEIGFDRLTARQSYLGFAVFRSQRLDGDTAADIDALGAVALGDEMGDLLRHAALQHALQPFDDRDLGAEQPRRCRKLQSDEPATDDGDMA